jgi:hypothetical protein
MTRFCTLLIALLGITFAQCSYAEQYRCRSSLDRNKIYLSHVPCDRGMSESDIDLKSEGDMDKLRERATYSDAKKESATIQCAQQAVGAYPFNNPYTDMTFWYQAAHDACTRITAKYANPTTPIRNAHDCAGRMMASRPAPTRNDSPGTDYIAAFRRCAN